VSRRFDVLGHETIMTICSCHVNHGLSCAVPGHFYGFGYINDHAGSMGIPSLASSLRHLPAAADPQPPVNSDALTERIIVTHHEQTASVPAQGRLKLPD
jgi:hypothetical protein